jgi:UDP-N-acetylmuramyl pentapeptide phosphotransferase/UDP-N-acetylglucosamine-1-phosphate transferase
MVWLTLILAIVTLVLTPITTDAGEWLYDMRPHPDAILQQHAERGGLIIYFSIALLVVAVALVVLRVAERRSENRRLPATVIVAIVALAVGISSIVQLYRVGDTGAQSVWGNEIAHLKQAAGK